MPGEMGVKLGKTQGHRQKSVELLLVTSRREKPSDTAEPTVSAVLDGDKLPVLPMLNTDTIVSLVYPT